MREIREFPVERGAVALWFIGQNGFVFKTHEGTVVATDLYLTNSCAAIAPPGMDFSRRVPVLIPPEVPSHPRVSTVHPAGTNPAPFTTEMVCWL